MRVKVTQRFIDKHSGEVHEVGDMLTISPERFAEISKVGQFVEEVEEAAPKTASASVSKTVSKKRRTKKTESEGE